VCGGEEGVYDELLSTFALNFKLWHQRAGVEQAGGHHGGGDTGTLVHKEQTI